MSHLPDPRRPQRPREPVRGALRSLPDPPTPPRSGARTSPAPDPLSPPDRAVLPTGRGGYRCTGCGAVTARWVGRCPRCQAWGSAVPVDRPARGQRPRPATAGSEPARPITEIALSAAHVQPTRVGELDRVLGGGLVPGAVVLVAGEPGVGKSTLLLQVAARAAAHTGPVLYASGEESAAQVRLRAERIGAVHEGLYLAAVTQLEELLAHLDALHPSLLVVDSVQTISSPTTDGSAGGVSQVRDVAAALTGQAKARAMPAILVGHVTKDGGVAGPRVLEHLVDVVLTFEGDPHARLRTVRATKNRYGATDEVGCFELTDGGLVELVDPSLLFRTQREQPVPGTCVTVALEGRRPLLAEVQALVADSSPGAPGVPRRAVSGLDGARTAMVLAVLSRRAGVPLTGQETYLATVGGVRLGEPAADLAVALAVASARWDVPIPTDVVAFGEVGLAGDVRPVNGVDRRVAEAGRLGARLALVPAATGAPHPLSGEGLPMIRSVRDVREALTILGIGSQR